MKNGNRLNQLMPPCEADPGLPAVVRLPVKDGFGVLVGNYDPDGANRCVILTAAGCVDIRQTWPDLCIQSVETWAGPLGLISYAEERIYDIAILGPPYENYEVYGKEREAWDEFCAKTMPMKLAREALIPGQRIGVRIFQRDAVCQRVDGRLTWVTRSAAQGWMRGKAKGWQGDMDVPSFGISTDQGDISYINAFGGPILNERGQLLGIIGGYEGTGEFLVGVQPFPGLPTWAVREFLGGPDE